MWVLVMKVGREGQEHHIWSLTYTLSRVKLLLEVCSTEPICVWFTKLFLMDIWSVFVNISFCIQQCFPFIRVTRVIRVAGFWTTGGFNRLGVNLGCSMVIQEKKTVIYSMNPTLKNLSEIRACIVTGEWVTLWCTSLWTVTVLVVHTLFPDCWMPVFLNNCPDCSLLP